MQPGLVQDCFVLPEVGQQCPGMNGVHHRPTTIFAADHSRLTSKFTQGPDQAKSHVRAQILHTASSLLGLSLFR